MALTKSTGFIVLKNNQKTAITIPATRIESARARFRGASKFDSTDASRSGTSSATFPSPPAGYQATGGKASHSITINAGFAGAEGTVGISAPGGSNSLSYKLGANVSQSYTVSTNCAGTGTAVGDYSISGSGSASGRSVTGTAYFKKETPSSDISVTVNGQATAGPASLNDGIISDWIALSALVPGDNTVQCTVGGSDQVYLEIEYTYQPVPPKPTLVAPEHYAVTDSKTPVFEFVLLPASGSDATSYHGRLMMSMSPTLDSAIIADSSLSQTSWEYWTGSAWAAMPAAGVAANNKIRYVTTVTVGNWYWAAATRDDWGVGEASATRTLRVVLSVDALEGYSLAVGTKGYKCETLTITESANGEISRIEFSVPNQNGEAHQQINYGEQVYLSVYDSTGAEKQYLGRVWKKQPDDINLQVIATMGDKVLADRVLAYL